MDLPEDFNSSDVEFEPAPSKASGRRPGQASIAKIIEEASNDRLSSKRTLRQLQFGHGAPGTRENQELWVERFNAFRRFTLKQSLDEPFNGDDVLRFFDSIVSKITPGSKGKPAPNDKVVLNGIRIISSYGTFTYPKSSGYELTKYDGSRLQTWLDDSVKAGRLTKGVWKQRVWLNFMTVSRMGRAWLDHHHKYGTWNWDITIARLLSIVLITSLGCRVGDVARSRLYTATEYMQYKHVELMVDGQEAKFENLRARITVEFKKGSKDIRNDNLEFYLHSLNDPNFYHMCPIALLLIHALRHGLVLGSTIEQVLEYAANASDAKVVWLFPDRPLFAAFSHKSTSECDLDKAAGNDQGFTTDQVRQSLGHSHSAFNRGTTDTYVGSPTREYYNDRAERQFVSRWGPKFSETSAFNIVKQSVTDEEIREWQQLNEPSIVDPDSINSRRRARDNIRRERVASFVRTAEPDTKKKKNGKKQALVEKSANDVNIISNIATSIQERSQARVSTVPTACPPHSNVQPGFDTGQIDPRLLDEDAFKNMQLDDVEIEGLNAEVLMTSSQVSSSEAAAEMSCMDALLEMQKIEVSGNNQCLTSAYDFIRAYSKINIVSKHTFALAWKRYCEGSTSFQDSIGQYSMTGNSRDDPTPMEHNCKKTQGCLFNAIRLDEVAQHEIYCNEALVIKKNSVKKFACSWDGCSRAFATNKELVEHSRRVHRFDPKPCPHACEPGKLYQTEWL
ncbi:hypothetical protein V1506DRAFT_505362 [Lipomyces tetrasporus]